MLKLVQGNLVEKRRVGRKTFFYIKESDRIAGILSNYKKSFLDEMVDNFVEIWDELNPPIRSHKLFYRKLTPIRKPINPIVMSLILFQGFSLKVFHLLFTKSISRISSPKEWQ